MWLTPGMCWRCMRLSLRNNSSPSGLIVDVGERAETRHNPPDPFAVKQSNQRCFCQRAQSCGLSDPWVSNKLSHERAGGRRPISSLS